MKSIRISETFSALNASSTWALQVDRQPQVHGTGRAIGRAKTAQNIAILFKR